MNKKFKLELNIDEILSLDGKVNGEAQRTIDNIKKEISYGFNDFPILNEILKQSEKQGRLNWTQKSIRSCDYCDKKPDYKRYARSGRYHNKGDRNFDKPIYYSGIKFNEGYISVSGHGDMCLGCCQKHKVKERLIDFIIESDLKIEIMNNEYKPGKYLKDNIRICYSCDAEILESEMAKEMVLMGNGFYPSGCPKCGAKSSAFGNSHKTTNRFGFIENPSCRNEVTEIRLFVENYNKDKDRENGLYLAQSSKTITSFSVKEERWSNGHYEIIQFGLKSRKYTSGRKLELAQPYIEILERYGYTNSKDGQ